MRFGNWGNIYLHLCNKIFKWAENSKKIFSQKLKLKNYQQTSIVNVMFGQRTTQNKHCLLFCIEWHFGQRNKVTSAIKLNIILWLFTQIFQCRTDFKEMAFVFQRMREYNITNSPIKYTRAVNRDGVLRRDFNIRS